MTHCRSEGAKCRSDWMEGSATSVIVASRTTMNCARQTMTTTTSQERCARSDRAAVREDIDLGGEGSKTTGPAGPHDRSISGPAGLTCDTILSVPVSDATALRVDAQRNLERILVAARECFAEHGLDVGVEEIVRRAGVGKATFFRRFPTKDALVLAVLEGFVDEVEVAADQAVRPADPLEGLREFLMYNMSMQAHNAAFFDAIAARFMGDSPPVAV